MKQAADQPTVSYWTVRGWVEAGHLPAIRPPAARPGKSGKLILIDVRDLDRFIAAFRTDPA